MPRLESQFYEQPTRQVAQQLLGKLLCRRLANGQLLSGIIVEVEAYLHTGDSASHSARGVQRKNQSMFEEPGTLYVYAIHARHCMNVVTEGSGAGAAVLIRGVEPLSGLDSMAIHRGLPPLTPQSTWTARRALTQGPGRLCGAFAIDRELDGINLQSSQEVWIESHQIPAWTMKTSPRIGISQAKELPLRYFIDGNHFVSGCARDHSQGRMRTFGDLSRVR